MSAEIPGRVAPQDAPLPLFGCSVNAGFPSPADDCAEAWLSLDELVGISFSAGALNRCNLQCSLPRFSGRQAGSHQALRTFDGAPKQQSRFHWSGRRG